MTEEQKTPTISTGDKKPQSKKDDPEYQAKKLQQRFGDGFSHELYVLGCQYSVLYLIQFNERHFKLGSSTTGLFGRVPQYRTYQAGAADPNLLGFCVVERRQMSKSELTIVEKRYQQEILSFPSNYGREYAIQYAEPVLGNKQEPERYCPADRSAKLDRKTLRGHLLGVQKYIGGQWYFNDYIMDGPPLPINPMMKFQTNILPRISGEMNDVHTILQKQCGIYFVDKTPMGYPQNQIVLRPGMTGKTFTQRLTQHQQYNGELLTPRIYGLIVITRLPDPKENDRRIKHIEALIKQYFVKNYKRIGGTECFDVQLSARTITVILDECIQICRTVTNDFTQWRDETLTI